MFSVEMTNSRSPECKSKLGTSFFCQEENIQRQMMSGYMEVKTCLTKYGA